MSPGTAHHTLDVVQRGLRGIAEHHHIAALRGVALGHLGVEHGQADAVGVLVHQDQVAHQQGGDHGAGRNLERLEQERAQHEDHEQHGEQAGRPVQPPGLLRMRVSPSVVSTMSWRRPLAVQLGTACGGLGQALGLLLALGREDKSARPASTGR